MLGTIILKKANILLPDTDLYRYRNQWLNLYPSIARWQEKGKAMQAARVLGSTPLGRKYVGDRYTDQLNIEVQGGGAEVAKLALHYMTNDIKALESSVMMVNFVHDDFCIEAPDDPEIYKQVALLMAHAMQRAWKECSQSFTIKDLPMPVTAGVAGNYGDVCHDTDLIYEYTLEG